MSGWLVAWRTDGGRLDEGKWRRAVRAAGAGGERVESVTREGHGVCAWRRESGEFPRSGTLTAVAGGAVCAWVGQCLEDEGDVSARAIGMLSGGIGVAGEAGGLNGPFAAAFVSGAGLTLWTDRHNHYPVYVRESGGTVVASTLLACVLPWVERVEIDRDALDLMLRTGEMLDQRVLLRGVSVMRGGSVRAFSEGRSEAKRYWRMDHRAARGMTIGKSARELGAALERAVRRMENANERLAVPLSGGLDSRLLLGLCRRPERVPSFTLGVPGCRDIRYAEMFARSVRSPHRVLDWDLPAFPRMWARGVEATGGCYGVTEMYVLPYAQVFAGACDVTLNGLCGDAFMGGNFLKLATVRARSTGALAELMWRWKVSDEVDGWADGLTGRRDGHAREMWRASLCAEGGPTPCSRLMDWLIENRTFRYVNGGTMLLRTAVESHAPFFDRDFVDVLRTVPLEHRLKHRLYLRVLNRRCPAAARVPWQRTALPPSWGFPAALVSLVAHRLVKEAGKRTGVDVLASMRMNEPDAWFRGGPWREASRGVLESEEFMERGLFAPDAVRGVLEAQDAGAKLSRTIGVMVAVELFCRQAMDGVELDEVGAAAPMTAA